MLDSQLTHVGVSRSGDVRAVGIGQTRPALLEQNHAPIHAGLFFDTQAIPPLAEIISVFDLPFHIGIVLLRNSNVKDHFGGWACWKYWRGTSMWLPGVRVGVRACKSRGARWMAA